VLLEPFNCPPARKAVRCDADFVLKSLDLTYQPLGRLWFAIAAQYYGNICVRRLWLHLIASQA
jgi:hypothetical protein